MPARTVLAAASLVCALSMPSAAQQPSVAAPKPEPIVVKMTALVEGRIVDVVKDATGEKERRVVERRVEWTVGKRTFASLEKAGVEIRRVAMQPSSMRPDPKTGGKALAPLRIEPGPNVSWDEVIGTFDAANRAGWTTVALADVANATLMPCAIEQGIVDDKDLRLPGCEFCEPDMGQFEKRFPVIDLHRGGRVFADERVVFEVKPGQKEDLSKLRETLRKLSKAAGKRGVPAGGPPGRRPRIGGQRESKAVLLRMDRWAQWRDVRRLLRELVDPKVGFDYLQPAVVERGRRLR